MAQADLVSFALGVLICAISLVALIGHALRPPPKDRLLLWLGVFAACYGVRLLATIEPIAASFITPIHAAYVENGISYVILVPAILFVEGLYGAGWRGSVRWIAVGAAIYALVGITVGVMTGDPGRVPDPALIFFTPSVVIVFAVGALTGYQPRPLPEWRILVGGFLVFLAFVFHEHAVNAGLLPWNLHVEPLGVLVFVGSLAYIVVGRFFAGQRQLIAIEKEMEAARQIQSSILPRELPSLSGVDVAARYVPLAAVAGDFYDVIRLEDGSLTILVADVSGHGVPAALVASMVKVAFVGEASRSGDPGTILHGMNATLCGMFERAYVTAVCVTVDQALQGIRYAIAGHPPPLLVEAAGVVQTLDERGIFIGMFPAATYRTTTVAVNGGARVILYTDGVIEAAKANSDDLFGIERLAAFAREERRRPAGEFTDALLARVTAFAGQEASHDDVTVVVVDLLER